MALIFINSSRVNMGKTVCKVYALFPTFVTLHVLWQENTPHYLLVGAVYSS